MGVSWKPRSICRVRRFKQKTIATSAADNRERNKRRKTGDNQTTQQPSTTKTQRHHELHVITLIVGRKSPYTFVLVSSVWIPFVFGAELNSSEDTATQLAVDLTPSFYPGLARNFV